MFVFKGEVYLRLDQFIEWNFRFFLAAVHYGTAQRNKTFLKFTLFANLSKTLFSGFLIIVKIKNQEITEVKPERSYIWDVK